LKNKSKSTGFYARWAKLFLFTAFLAAPLAFFGAGKAIESNVNKVEDWLPATFRETGELKWFRTHFPTDQFVIVSWEGCRIAGNPEVSPWEEDDPRIAKLASLLIPPESAQDPESQECRKYFKSVTTGRQVLDQLVSKPLELPFDEAVSRLKGSLLGPDGRQTCVIVNLTPESSNALKKVLGRGMYRLLRPSIPPGVLRRQIAAAGIEIDSLHLGGPPVDNISIDEEGERTLIRLAGLSGLLGLFLAWWSLRSVMLTAVVFFCGVLSAATALAIIWLTGETVDAIVLSMPSLVYVLAISSSVHLVNYYRDAVQEGGEEGAAERAVAHAFKPALLCSITTAVGLFSLNASELVPIRKFGIYSAAGVLSMLIIVFFFIPATLPYTKIAKKWLQLKKEGKSKPSDRDMAETIATRFFGLLATWIIRRHALVTAACLTFIIAVSYGLTKTRTSIDLLELFDSRSKILQDYRWLESNLGMLVPLEIVVRFSPESQALEKSGKLDPESKDLFQLTFLERMETVAVIQETIEKQFGQAGQGVVGRSLSAATFAPTLPPATGDSQTFLHRRVVNTRLQQSRDNFISSGFLKFEEVSGTELWRISLRVAAFEGVDYGQFVHELRDTVQPIMEAHKHRVDILRTLAQNRDEQGVNGCRVFLWDKPIPKEAEKLSTEEAAKIANHRAMVTALAAMLKTARLNVVRGEKNPNEIPLVKIQQLGKLDSVVLVGPFNDSEAALLSSALGNVIDLHAPLPSLDIASQEQATDGEPWLSAVYTGVVPIVYKAQRALLQSLISSTFWSFATITPLMIFVARGFRPGLVAMIPNVLPVLAIFGGMGWLGIPIDIGSMMTASIALGVAVDDTIHYLSWFRVNMDQLKNRNDAIVRSYKSAALPTLQTALISGLGLSVFAFSTFTPTQRFGWLMLAILIAGVVAELIMLPAILAGPLGKCFENPRRRRPIQRWLLLARYELRRRKDQRQLLQDVRRAA
jgi:uncharacterized protein